MVEISLRSLCLLALTLAGIRSTEAGRIRSPRPDPKAASADENTGRSLLQAIVRDYSPVQFPLSDASRTITSGVEEERGRRHNKRSAERRRMQVTEMENSTLLSVPAFAFPDSYGDTIIVTPVAYVRKDGKNRNVISYDTSTIRSTDVTLRLRTAKIYVNVEHRPVATRRHQSRGSRSRHGFQRRDVIISPFLIQDGDTGGSARVVSRGKYWLEYTPGIDANRSGRTRASSRIIRYVFDVTQTGLKSSIAAVDENATDDRDEGDLPTLASWRMPDVQMALLCRRRRTRAFVKCQRNGVLVHGAPYLELTTAHVDGSNYGIRW